MLPFFWLWQLYQGCYFFPDKASAIKPSATREKTSFLSIKHAGQAANSHSICQCNVSQSKISCSAYRSPQLSVGVQAASWRGCTETWAADHPQSLGLPGTSSLLHAPAQAHCKLAASAWGPLSESNSHSAKTQSLNDSYPSKQHLRLWGKGLSIQWRLTYICETLAIGASLSIARVCQICCP